jgi:NAD(P)-dependent dehydrogenase (short-subunit alcohol dehydrogenase family)
MMARIASITGAASGIGRALASALVTRGDTVVTADIDGDGAERAAAELAGRGPGAATPAMVDVRDAAADRLAADIVRGIDRNAALVIAPASARVAAYLWRYAPLVVNRMAARQLAWARATFPAQPADRADTAPRR